MLGRNSSLVYEVQRREMLILNLWEIIERITILKERHWDSNLPSDTSCQVQKDYWKYLYATNINCHYLKLSLV